MQPLISICIPCYNKAEHLPALIGKLQTLNNKAEICVFDNGSNDNPESILKNLQFNALPWHFLRSSKRGSIDFGWLSALSMGSGKYLKLQLGDDMPNDAGIIEVIDYLEKNPNIDFVVGDSNVDVSQVDPEVAKSAVGYYNNVKIIKQALNSIQNHKQGFDFVLKYMFQGNALGDINSLIFRKNALEGFSPYLQSYYGCLGHPDAEIYSFLITNRMGCYLPVTLSSFIISAASPSVKAAHDRQYARKVYELPAIIQPFLLLVDPSYDKGRKQISTTKYWIIVLRAFWLTAKKLRRSWRDG